MSYLSGKALLLSVLGIGTALLFAYNVSHLALPEDETVIAKREILTGSTFSVLAAEEGLPTSTVSAIIESAKDVYDLARITAGKQFAFVYDKATGNLRELVYEINKEEKLIIKNLATTTSAAPAEGRQAGQVTSSQWEATREPIEYTTDVATAKGVIESSLYGAILDQGLDERLALALAETFAWQIDFATQIQKGDSFKVIYEKRYREGEYDHPGKVLAAEFTNGGEKFVGFYFDPVRDREGSQRASVSNGVEGTETKAGHYDQDGNSLKKVFLKAPLQFKYISSGFSYARVNPVTGVGTSPHRGIDYAAPQGTPVVTVGDGTILEAGWKGQYGLMIKVRHNEMYSTVYGHFSSLAKGMTVGKRVSQGQVIAYVGSTGLSTGPHLHYEMHKFGSFVNPFTEEIPPGEPVHDSDRAAFEATMKNYQKRLSEI